MTNSAIPPLPEAAHGNDRQAPQETAGAGRRTAVPQVYGPPEGNLLLVGWGSTQGPIREAVDRARAAGDSVSALHIKYINPLPPGLENIFSGFNHVRVVEMNDEGLYGYGQFAGLLRARFCDPKIRGINKTDGLTWKVREILERAKTPSPKACAK
jgi:2-oxoglutarate ferredoxin oxidoreductase subunit alpha